MSVSPISSGGPIYQPPANKSRGDIKNPQAVFDGEMMQQAMNHGNLSLARQAYAALTQATNGSPFRNAQLTQDFQAIGQQLQSGNLAAAQQAFATLQSDFNSLHGITQDPAPGPVPPVTADPGSDPASGVDLQA